MTGVCWAVLTAYARTLPPGLERLALARSLRAGTPSKMGQNLARVVAARSGLTVRGRLTAKGRHAARVFLALHGLALPGEG